MAGEGGFRHENCVLLFDAIGEAIFERDVLIVKAHQDVDCPVAGFVFGIVAEVIFPVVGSGDRHGGGDRYSITN